MATYDPAEVDRLIAEAREDDARMPEAPFDTPFCDPRDISYGNECRRLCSVDPRIDPMVANAIARQRNNLRSMADQLEAAKACISGLKLDLRNTGSAASHYLREVGKVSEMHNERARRVLQLEEALREACILLRGGGQSMITTSKIDALVAVAGPRPCATCDKPGCRPMEHAGWDPTEETT